MSAVFAERVVVNQAGEQGKGVVSLVDARLKPGETVEIEIRPVPARKSSGPLFKTARSLALDLPPDYSTSFEVRL